MNLHRQNFLIINPFGIGDVLFSTPLILNLKHYYPQSHISYLCNARTYPILSHQPLIDNTIVYERDDFKALQKESWVKWIAAYAGLIKKIREGNFDIAFDLSLNTPYGFFCMLAGIHERIGLDFKGRGKFLTKKIEFSGYNDTHVIEYYLKVLVPLQVDILKFPMQVIADNKNRAKAADFIKGNRLEAKKIIGVAPCGGQAFGPHADIKRWPIEHFAELIKKLLYSPDISIFLFVGPSEKKELDTLLSLLGDYKKRCYEFSNASLLELIAYIEHIDIMISNDTGPLRFADALGKKIVALFGPVSEIAYGPYPYEEARTRVLTFPVPCRPCYRQFRLARCEYAKKCLTDISVEDAYDACRALL